MIIYNLHALHVATVIWHYIYFVIYGWRCPVFLTTWGTFSIGSLLQLLKLFVTDSYLRIPDI